MDTPYDLVIENGRVLDGLGNPAVAADVAIRGDRIAAIGDGKAWTARKRIDAKGRIVAPGFIDVHTHDDRELIRNPQMAMKITQGVTSVVTGNCGISIAPARILGDTVPAPLTLLSLEPSGFFANMESYISALDAAQPAVNSLMLVGHSSLRASVMDRLDRPATREETRAMRDMLAKALAGGAAGLSTGLYYPTAQAATTEEVVGVAAVLAEFGGIYTSHLRDESDHVCEAMEEAFTIGRSCSCPVVLSHHKVTGPHNHGRTRETLAIVDRVRQEQRVALDVYPYAASSTILEPRRVKDGEKIIVTWSTKRPGMEAIDLRELAAREGKDPTRLAEELLPAGAIYFSMSEEDVARVIAHPAVMIGSDGLPHDSRPHPRLWGTFPRVLGRYVRESKTLGLEEAVRRMTSLTAAQFGMRDRGVLRAGCYADVTVFDPDTVLDRATFADSVQPSAGIDSVVVNGTVVLSDGAVTGARAGRFIGNADRAETGFERPAWAA